MENLYNLEQPTSQLINTDNVNEQIIEGERSTVQEVQEGSNFGKFKDATSLLNAYNNLEKEFTRKSQKLSELLKNNEKRVNAFETNQSLENKTTEDISMFKQKDWKNNVLKFFDKNPNAKNYAKEIASTIINDKELAKNKNCLEYAYALASLKSRVEPADLLNDPKHIEDILSNQNIKEKIITKYLQDIKNNKSNLKFISGEATNISPTRPIDKPKNLKEASTILKRLLQS